MTSGTGRALRLFRTWFWRPPRAHGDAIIDRRVSPLELLYDLVYVAVISQAGRSLAAHVTLVGVADFAVVFSLTWIAWVNGSLYLDLHGRPDGRTRAYVFVQMGVLAILAVFAGDAGGGGGSAFAIAYAAFLVVMTWLWYSVRRRDAVERPEHLADAGRYVVAMAVSVVVMVASAFLTAEARLPVWAVFVAGWIVLAGWILGHLPIALSIAAAGAGMVSLLEHAHDTGTPLATAWLLAGAVAAGLIAVIPTSRALADAGRLAAAYRTLQVALAVGAVASVVIGLTRPTPWLLALSLVVVLALVWAVAVRGFLLAGAWGVERAKPG